MLKFLLQSDDVTLMEKRAVSVAAMQNDWQIVKCPLSSIVDTTFDKSFVPVGTVEFVKAFMLRHNIAVPDYNTYPEYLQEFLKRKIVVGKFCDAPDNYFVKPYNKVKSFTGAIKSTLSGISPDELVYISEPVNFISEVRYYISNGCWIGEGRYDDFENDVIPDEEVVTDARIAFTLEHGDTFSLDFGVTDTGETLLVEANDAWALGHYKGTCSGKGYAKMLATRWAEMTC